MANYDNVQRLLGVMKDTFGTRFNCYYDDDPEQIPDFNLPCLVVSQLGDTTQQAAFEQDDVEEELVVKVILNKKDDFDSEVDPTNMTQRKIRDLIGKRDPVTGQYDTQSVKGALRDYGLEGIIAIAPQMTTVYGITPRYNDQLTAEGHVTFRITYSVNTNESAI